MNADRETLRTEIPQRLQTARRWLLWKLVPNPDPTKKPRKVPLYCDGTLRRGTLDVPEDVARLGTFEVALEVLDRGGYSGLGFAPYSRPRSGAAKASPPIPAASGSHCIAS
jgi:primase-polymerase (primpol)-like protein